MKSKKHSSETLFLILGNIDEELIEKAAPLHKKSTFYPIKKIIPFVTCMAACILAVLFLHKNPITETLPEELPLLTIAENGVLGAGESCGFLLCDPSELKDANPWSKDAILTTLPVYRSLDSLMVNTEKRKEKKDLEIIRYFNHLLSEEKNIIKRLGKNPDTISFDPVKPYTYSITGIGDGIRISASNFSDICLNFQPAVTLPEEYHFTKDASYEEIVKAAEYLKTEYHNLINMSFATANIYKMGYDFFGNPPFYQVEFFNAEGSMEEQIINYHFRTVQFCCDYDGNLSSIRFHDTDLSDKIGDYPIITAEEAKELLLKGNYFNYNNFSAEFPEEDFIIETKLVYPPWELEYYIPYYRFTIEQHGELPDYVKDRTLRNFEYYYVPAIESTYITNMPLQFHP